MYSINLPDEVMIPDVLLAHVESGDLGEKAKTAAVAWVKDEATAKGSLRDFWRKRITRNVDVCKRFEAPECAEFFEYVCALIEKSWK